VGGTSGDATVTINFSTQPATHQQHVERAFLPPPTAYQFANAFPNITFNQPLCLATPPGETNRLFVCQKGGLLRVLTNLNASISAAPTVLDLPALLISRGETISTSGEQGLLGLAFHPNFPTSNYFYIYYSVATNGTTYERLARFSMQAANSNAADTASE